MLHATPQERQALVVVALLLAAGVGARLGAAPADAAWTEPTGAVVDSGGDRALQALRGRVAAEVERERVRATPLGAGETLDVNRAPAEQLDRLPRVGPALAARIVAHREAHGPFRSAEQLSAVPGVGPAVLASVQPYLRLPAAPAAGTRRVPLNRADAAALEALPGIGARLAERIVAHRAAHGPFRSLDELQQVPGIGPALSERLAPLLELKP